MDGAPSPFSPSPPSRNLIGNWILSWSLILGRCYYYTFTILQLSEAYRLQKYKYTKNITVLYRLGASTTSLVTFLKGQSNEIFDLQFFSSFKPALASGQGVKYFGFS